ncbi:MAG: hypothetical protein J6Z08_03385 [Elusimicrobiales bacterium]|nr:hypothetical protein [Elusimicrobiales bacterium]
MKLTHILTIAGSALLLSACTAHLNPDGTTYFTLDPVSGLYYGSHQPRHTSTYVKVKKVVPAKPAPVKKPRPLPKYIGRPYNGPYR